MNTWMRHTLALLALLLGGLCQAANPLVEAAKERLKHWVIYDGAYTRIDYPNGDVHPNKGVCTDVVIRSYRNGLNIDLQRRVHEDMQQAFDAYPALWGLSRPDRNIDHRRVPNLETFFRRHGEVLPISQMAADYRPGDIVSWRLNGSGLPHIGVVSDATNATGEPMIIHNIGLGPRQETFLFKHRIEGHFRYPKESQETSTRANTQDGADALQ